MLNKKIIIAVLLLSAVVVAGCVEQQAPAPTIQEPVSTPEFAQDGGQAVDATNDLWSEAYSGSPADLPAY